jgi:hypothetical protein
MFQTELNRAPGGGSIEIVPFSGILCQGIFPLNLIWDGVIQDDFILEKFVVLDISEDSHLLYTTIAINYMIPKGLEGWYTTQCMGTIHPKQGEIQVLAG